MTAGGQQTAEEQRLQRRTGLEIFHGRLLAFDRRAEVFATVSDADSVDLAVERVAALLGVSPVVAGAVVMSPLSRSVRAERARLVSLIEDRERAEPATDAATDSATDSRVDPARDGG